MFKHLFKKMYVCSLANPSYEFDSISVSWLIKIWGNKICIFRFMGMIVVEFISYSQILM